MMSLFSLFEELLLLSKSFHRVIRSDKNLPILILASSRIVFKGFKKTIKEASFLNKLETSKDAL